MRMSKVWIIMMGEMRKDLAVRVVVSVLGRIGDTDERRYVCICRT